MDEGKNVTEDKEVVKTLNQYSSTAVNFFYVTENKYLITETENLEYPIGIEIKKFENRPSVISIKKTIHINELFQSSGITSENILS